MTVDPTDPDTFAETDDEGEAPEIGVETPEADTAEQYADLAPEEEARVPEGDLDRAAEGDLAEQARVVGNDEDDYR